MIAKRPIKGKLTVSRRIIKKDANFAKRIAMIDLCLSRENVIEDLASKRDGVKRNIIDITDRLGMRRNSETKLMTICMDSDPLVRFGKIETKEIGRNIKLEQRWRKL